MQKISVTSDTFWKLQGESLELAQQKTETTEFKPATLNGIELIIDNTKEDFYIHEV